MLDLSTTSGSGQSFVVRTDKDQVLLHRAPQISPAEPSSLAILLPIMAVVFVAFLIIGFALPVLPLHVHQGLGLSTFVVGIVTGSQFVASVISRICAGQYADAKGAKHAVVAGLLTAVACGLLYLVSLRLAGTPVVSVTILLPGRALLGGAESFIITGAVTWGLALVGSRTAGRAIAWMGMAMFAALLLGHRWAQRSTLLVALPPLQSPPLSYRCWRCCLSRSSPQCCHSVAFGRDCSRLLAPSGCQDLEQL